MTKEEIKQRLSAAVQKSSSRHKIRKIYLFGSQLHGNTDHESDVDLLIDLTEESMGLFEFVGLKMEFEQEIGKSVDLVEPEALSKYIRNDVLNEAETIYEAA